VRGPTPWAMTRLHLPRISRGKSGWEKPGGSGPGPSDLGDLVEAELDGGLAAEDRHQHLELLALRADLGDGRRQRLERAVGDRDRLADLEVHLDRGGRRRAARGGRRL